MTVPLLPKISAKTKVDQTVLDVALESVRAAILLGIVGYLWRVGRNRFDQTRSGWSHIVGGFGLLLFGSILDISDNFEGLNFLVVVGDTEVEAILEKFVGFLGGFVMIAVGLMRWVPSVQRLNLEISERREAEEALREARDDLELRVEERTRDIERKNETLKQEITERKRAEEALRESRDQFRLITNNLPAGISYFDSEQRYRFVNRTLEEWYDRPAEEILGRTIGDILGKEVQDRTNPSVDATLRGEVQNYEHVVTYPGGKTRAVYVQYVPHIDETKKVQGYFALVHDITERKHTEEALLASEQALQERIADLEEAHRKLEMQGESLVRLADDLLIARDEARAADRTKSEFLANMSHELRTPLNAIIGFSEIIKDETFGPVGSTKYRDYADDINESGQHLLSLINDILDLSKIESGTDELHEENIEISGIANAIMKSVLGLARRGNVELELDVSEDIPMLHADERKVKQILLNLLSNAIKFTPDGGKVTLKIWSRSESGCVFQVIDTGIGIAFEDIPKALAPFQQIDSSLNRKHEGTGLGLSLTKALVEMHSGYLDLQSEVGVGTIVTVRFPAERIVRLPHDTKAVSAAHGMAS